MKHLFLFLALTQISINITFASEIKNAASCDLKIFGNKVPECPQDSKDCIFKEFKNKKISEVKLNIELNGLSDGNLNIKKANLDPTIQKNTFDVTLIEDPKDPESSKNKNTAEVTYLNSNEVNYSAVGSDLNSTSKISFNLKNQISYETALDFILPEDNNKEKIIILEENKILVIKCKNQNEYVYNEKTGKESILKSSEANVSGNGSGSVQRQ